MQIAGSVALVTGASRGLGEALASRLAREGATVMMAARGCAELEAVVERIRAVGGRAHAVVADLGDPASAWPLASAAAALAGPVDILVHNASTLGPVPLRPLLDTGDHEFREAFEVNVGGPFRLTRAVVGGMIVRGRGLVVLVSSDAAVEAYAGWGAYGASKAALEQMARVWAAELEGTGVRMLTVDPGEMDTRMLADAMPGADRRRLASPWRVADTLLSVIRAAESLRSGTRVALADWKVHDLAAVAIR